MIIVYFVRCALSRLYLAVQLEVMHRHVPLLKLIIDSTCRGTRYQMGHRPVVTCDAFRDLILSQEEDMVVGLIFIGWSKNGVGGKRMPRRRRVLDGDVLRDI